ncbi:MAG: class I SAM-dependent RNA methyltransferase [bacterium]|nr:class I SAM-dependent RNA methyltransferase [bacterium]
MNKVILIATTAFGLEKIVKKEVTDLGFKITGVMDGRIEFEATINDIPVTNIWLRCADRVLIKAGEFTALTFDSLFENTKAIDWGAFITEDGRFTVKGKSVKSKLGSIRACQSIVKKAVVEKLKEKYKTEQFKETGPDFTIQISILKDTATLTIDTSGPGLHKRGYRVEFNEAPLKETMASALVLLSFWNKERLLIDPMCGSGTILIEAAMIARNIAPGINRKFVSEQWPVINRNIWKKIRQDALNAVDSNIKLQIIGYDINEKNIQSCLVNARKAGVQEDIIFKKQDIKDLWVDKQYGIVISNPPYGIRISDFKKINDIYIDINKIFKKKKGWSIYILTADEMFPEYFKRTYPDRVRKLYNGRIQVNYYQYYGEKPDK